MRLPQAADVHVVHSYALAPHDMSILVTPRWSRRPAPATSCQAYTVLVTDEYDRPVLGANVDVHAAGPGDELILYGTGLAAPQSHSNEQTPPCPSTPVPVPQNPRTQGDHNVPGGVDAKHVENIQGTGLDALAQASGRTSFSVASQQAGFTDLLVWVDEEPMARETDQRPLDDDVLDTNEPFTTARTQWTSSPITLSFDRVGGTTAAGTCFPYVVKARSGTAPVPGINVDVHATGPDDELDFCNPPGTVPRRAPAGGAGANAHAAEGDSESRHVRTDAADTQHTEGETDPAGNFVVGLTSPVTGDTTAVAWIDGETGADDDGQQGGEATASGTVSWASSASEAEVSFLDPSPYGGPAGAAGTAGAGSGTQVPDAGGTAEVLVRVDMAGQVPGVEVLLSGDGRRTFSVLGEATRVGQSDVFELEWPIAVPDGSYGLRARVIGTDVVEDVDVKVGAGDLLPMVPNSPYESLRLERPRVAAPVPFSRRATTVSGSATAGAEGVDVFYTKVPAKDTPRTADWIFCGYADLSGTGTGRQQFTTPCTLTGSDQAAQVTGISAITYDCAVDGCDANPRPAAPADGAPPPAREQGQKETGQALRVFGYEANPLLAIEPAEAEAVTGECRRFEVVLRDQTRQPLGGENVDLHLDGSSSAHFCRPPDAGPGLRAPRDGGHAATSEDPAALEASHNDPASPVHTEAETLPDGTLVFGVTSDDEGNSAVTAWLDRSDDDLQDASDPSDTGLLHWVTPPGCSILGSEGPDVLTGTSGADVFCGLEGNDLVKGRGGDDTVFAGGGADRVSGGSGHDSLRGGRGRDRLAGGPGRDSCRGGPGRDRILRCEAGSRDRPAVAPRRGGV